MLISGETIRLNGREQQLLTALTRSSPAHIKTKRQLKHFVHAHLVNYPGRSPEERLLRDLLASFLLASAPQQQGADRPPRDRLPRGVEKSERTD